MTLRCAEPSDAEVLNAAVRASIDELAPYMPWVDPIPTVEDTRQNIVRACDPQTPIYELRFLAFEEATGDFVGSIGIRPKDPDTLAFEIGYWIDTRKSGRGLMSEAVKAVVQFGFAQLGASAIRIKTAFSNTRSRKIPERLGFSCEAVVPGGEKLPDGSREDMVVYAIFRS